MLALTEFHKTQQSTSRIALDRHLTEAWKNNIFLGRSVLAVQIICVDSVDNVFPDTERASKRIGFHILQQDTKVGLRR